MKLDIVEFPLGSEKRAKAQLASRELLKALHTCQTGGIPFESIRADIDRCVNALCTQRSFGTVLSAYYKYGQVDSKRVLSLLRLLYEAGDYPGLLKQAYRFDVYCAMRDEIDKAIKWHIDHSLPDAEAWRRKFAKLREYQTVLVSDLDILSIDVEDDSPEIPESSPRTYELRPYQARQPYTTRPVAEPESDPYIISQVARVKMEQANATHARVLSKLRDVLRSSGFEVSESKLIDAFSVLSDGPAIFEAKSITTDNEREQIRHAMSQLYEYRFLHSMHDASLWVVLSQELSSRWYVDYITRDRGLRLIWLDGDRFTGPSASILELKA